MSADRSGMTLGVLAAIRAIVAIHGGSNRDVLLGAIDAEMDALRCVNCGKPATTTHADQPLCESCAWPFGRDKENQ